MGSLTNTAETEMLDHVLNNLAYSSPANVYVALCTADPTDAATGASCNEVTNTGSYQRTAITFGAVSSRRTTQSGAVTFPELTGSPGTASHWAIVTSQTYGAGDCLAYGAFASSKVLSSGNTPSIASGEIYVEISTGDMSDYLVGKILDHLFRATTYTYEATWMALTTATISDGLTGSTITEPGVGGYARKQVNVNGGSSPTWDLASSGAPSFVDNTHDIVVGTASGAAWGTIVAACLCTASTAGNVLFYDNDVADQAVGDGDTYQFDAGSADCKID